MITPQEIRERSENLEHAVFGGYAADDVDELIAAVLADYSEMQKENTVLNSKVKVLAGKIEEYRTESDSINRALLTAQKTADDIVAQAQRKASQLLSDTEEKMRSRSQELHTEIQSEEKRAKEARDSAQTLIANIQEQLQSELARLERLKQTDPKLLATQPVSQRDVDSKAVKREQIAPETEPQKEPESDTDVARQIEENLSRIFQKPEKTVSSEEQDKLDDTRVAGT